MIPEFTFLERSLQCRAVTSVAIKERSPIPQSKF